MDEVEQSRGRLAEFVGHAPFTGKSGKVVYPGGIFVTEGPNTFYSDIRAILQALADSEAECKTLKEAANDREKYLGEYMNKHAKQTSRAELAEAQVADLTAKAAGLVEAAAYAISELDAMVCADDEAHRVYPAPDTIRDRLKGALDNALGNGSRQHDEATYDPLCKCPYCAQRTLKQ